MPVASTAAGPANGDGESVGKFAKIEGAASAVLEVERVCIRTLGESDLRKRRVPQMKSVVHRRIVRQ